METKGHILSSFDDALRELKETTIGMGAATQRNLQNAMRGLLERDKGLCNQAIADDDDEDRLEIEIDRLGMGLIIKFRPLAHDLRMVIASMKTSSHLERISDQAVSIAKRARKMLKNPVKCQSSHKLRGFIRFQPGCLPMLYWPTPTIIWILLCRSSIGKNSSKKYKNPPPAHYPKSWNRKPHNHVITLTLSSSADGSKRVGNLATNIAEDVVFEETSTDIRHGGELPPGL